MKTPYLILTCSLALLGAAATTTAQTVLFNNTGQPRVNNYGIYYPAGFADTTPINNNIFFNGLGQQFKGNDGQEYTLNSVSLLLNHQNYTASSPLSVSIYSGTTAPAGPALETLSWASGIIPEQPYGGTTYGLVTNNSTGLTLDANLSYWVVLTATTDNNPANETDYVWSATDAVTVWGGQHEIISPYQANYNEAWSLTGAGSYQMSVLATATAPVPEPSTLALVGLGGGLSLLWQFRRRR